MRRLGLWPPADALAFVSAVSLLVAICSATQDIAIDAYRREVLPTEAELALGNSIHVQVYRLSGLVPGSLGLVLADLLDWSWIFPIMAAFMLVGVGLTLSVKEAVAEPRIPPSLAAAVAEPFREFFARRSLGPALAVLAFMFFYKLGDNMATALSTPFYIDLGFSPTQIGVIAKNAALWPSVIGGLLGGLAIVKIGINKALWLFGGVQLATIFGFVWLSGAGADPWVLAAVISAEYLGVGLGTAASVAFIARETSRLAVATQFALFTALAALPRTLASMSSGLIVDGIAGRPSFIYAPRWLFRAWRCLFGWRPTRRRPRIGKRKPLKTPPLDGAGRQLPKALTGWRRTTRSRRPVASLDHSLPDESHPLVGQAPSLLRPARAAKGTAQAGVDHPMPRQTAAGRQAPQHRANETGVGRHSGQGGHLSVSGHLARGNHGHHLPHPHLRAGFERRNLASRLALARFAPRHRWRV